MALVARKNWARLVVASLVLTSLGLWACGADKEVAPRSQRQAATLQCQGLADLMPAFIKATRSGKTAGLKHVIETYLAGPSPENAGAAAPMNQVLAAVFRTVTEFAKLPPEVGAGAGEKCAETAPPLEQANPLCEMRRAIHSLVHEAGAVQTLKLVDPLLTAVFDYVVGRAPSTDRPHYSEIAGAFAGMCEQSAVCDVRDTLDLVVGLSAYAGTPEGHAGMDRLESLVNNPELQPFIVDDGNRYGGEKGVVDLTRLVLRAVLAMDDPSDLNSIPVTTFSKGLRPQLEAALGDMKTMLQPNRSPNVLRPMKRVLGCLNLKDPELHTVRMLYHLGLVAPIPEFGIHNIIRVVRGLRDSDSRGSLLRMTEMLAQAVRKDDEAIDGAARVCRALFSLSPEPGKLKSNAELALPVLADLFKSGVMSEAICAGDTLLYGCAGGDQPACVSRADAR